MSAGEHDQRGGFLWRLSCQLGQLVSGEIGEVVAGVHTPIGQLRDELGRHALQVAKVLGNLLDALLGTLDPITKAYLGAVAVYRRPVPKEAHDAVADGLERGLGVDGARADDGRAGDAGLAVLDQLQTLQGRDALGDGGDRRLDLLELVPEDLPRARGAAARAWGP